MAMGQKWIFDLFRDFIRIHTWNREECLRLGAYDFGEQIFPDIWRHLHGRKPTRLGEIAWYGEGVAVDENGQEHSALVGQDQATIKLYHVRGERWLESYAKLMGAMNTGQRFGKYWNGPSTLVCCATHSGIVITINLLLLDGKGCPYRDLIADHVAGKLFPRQREIMLSHFEECVPCSQEERDLRLDSTLEANFLDGR